MTDPTPPASSWDLAADRFERGTWTLRLTPRDGEGPRLDVTLRHRPVPGVETATEGGDTVLTVPVPPEALSDGAHTILVSERKTGATVASLQIVAGAPLAEDIRAEIDLVRAELDILKQAFRRQFAGRD
ncbi:hypothetical protein E2L08_10005 [Palleronia sediminis]|uniref:Uncharacterized protein n=1 Tax=Palleronia sediminis TaxID=2547833 RepID=A0A4R6A967_9RHOB|nr:hypothetical protein [Palleronia sediminis]TDL79352.1 hypothetical protein E2L08_10005 [Palleronia sediminis]